jgi:leucyl-tRNA---protein transferase
LTPYFNSIAPTHLLKTDLDELLSMGWYRMHQTLFTCSHIEVNEALYRVHWLRFMVSEITDRASHQKIRRRNKTFRVVIEDVNSIDAEHIYLHANYRNHIDFDGATSIQECLFGEEPPPYSTIFDTKCISIFDTEQLVAAGYFDVGEKAAASILHFYNPAYARYSLGKFLILITLDYLKEQGMPYYYPGYVVQDVSKMNYKLFLGEDSAEYFEPETMGWKRFHGQILNSALR